jgi:hypothetical protein
MLLHWKLFPVWRRLRCWGHVIWKFANVQEVPDASIMSEHVWNIINFCQITEYKYDSQLQLLPWEPEISPPSILLGYTLLTLVLLNESNIGWKACRLAMSVSSQDIVKFHLPLDVFHSYGITASWNTAAVPYLNNAINKLVTPTSYW